MHVFNVAGEEIEYVLTLDRTNGPCPGWKTATQLLEWLKAENMKVWP